MFQFEIDVDLDAEYLSPFSLGHFTVRNGVQTFSTKAGRSDQAQMVVIAMIEVLAALSQLYQGERRVVALEAGSAFNLRIEKRGKKDKVDIRVGKRRFATVTTRQLIEAFILPINRLFTQCIERFTINAPSESEIINELRFEITTINSLLQKPG